MTGVTDELPPIAGYRLVLPPGWVRIPLRHGTDQAIDKALNRAFEGFGRDEVAKSRRDLDQRLRVLVDDARRKEGLDFYLPVVPMHGLPVPASFLVSEGRFDTLAEVDAMEMVLALAAASDGAEPADLDGSIALRRDSTLPADPDRGAEFPSRRVDYTVAPYDDPKRWLVIAFSTMLTDETAELADLLTELFDAVMTTFRWQRVAERVARRTVLTESIS